MRSMGRLFLIITTERQQQINVELSVIKTYLGLVSVQVLDREGHTHGFDSKSQVMTAMGLVMLTACHFAHSPRPMSRWAATPIEH